MRYVFLTIAGIFSVGLCLAALFFRSLRSYFPIPPIGSEKIVGFAQYNGYPLFFDTFLFFGIIGFLFLAVFLTKLGIKLWRK